MPFLLACAMNVDIRIQRALTSVQVGLVPKDASSQRYNVQLTLPDEETVIGNFQINVTSQTRTVSSSLKFAPKS